MMHHGPGPAQPKKLRLGIAASPFDEEVISRMLRSIDAPCDATVMGGIGDDALSAVHTVLLVNPTCANEQWDALFRHLEAGGTILVLLSCELNSHMEAGPVLSRLGLALGYSAPVRSVRLRYEADYPVTTKRTRTELLRCPEPHRFATFRSQQPGPLHQPLVTAGFFLARRCITIQVHHGRGAIVFTNSMAFAEDRVAIVTHLLKRAASRKSLATRDLAELPAAELAGVVNGLFEVYDEIPLDVVARELAPSVNDLDRLGLLAALEKTIRSGELPARLRGDTVIRSW